MKKLVSIRALTARINRKLAKESKKLMKYKPAFGEGAEESARWSSMRLSI